MPLENCGWFLAAQENKAVNPDIFLNFKKCLRKHTVTIHSLIELSGIFQGLKIVFGIFRTLSALWTHSQRFFI